MTDDEVSRWPSIELASASLVGHSKYSLITALVLEKYSMVDQLSLGLHNMAFQRYFTSPLHAIRYELG